jgi:urea carboxylase
MIGKVLVANRGAIAVRVMRTLKRMGISTVAVYSEADRSAMHVMQADEAVLLGPGPAAQSYLAVEKIIAAAQATGAEAIHPGYGFLSENAAFAEACEAAGLIFIGPTPAQMRQFGLKHTAREIAGREGVPLLPGTSILATATEAAAEAARIGYPVMLKSTAGGGGIGMRLCRAEEELREAFEAVERLGRANFSQSGVYLEKFVEHARHIEVQIFGDGRGHVLALGERDCSAQRRNQKVIEETPAPGLTDEQRARLFEAAIRMGRAVRYRNAGTVEFVFDARTGEFYFLEVNTRLQVEHGVTEEATGVDLVEWMLRVASGEGLPAEAPPPLGAAIQVRVYAEDPAVGFQPCSGQLTSVVAPAGARVDTWVESGSEVSPYYDPLLAKIIVNGAKREEAVDRLVEALAEARFDGLETNLRYLRAVAASEGFRTGGFTTRLLESIPYTPIAIEVVDGGTQTTVQDSPGRLGYWDIGVPPSGPMDALALHLANRAVGNKSGAAGLEMAVIGATLRFRHEVLFALGGAAMGATLDGVGVELYKPVKAPAGSVLKLGAASGPGQRAYLAVRGGLDVPEYLGSRSTFILGRFGGHGGRSLRAGDVLHCGPEPNEPPVSLPASLLPELRNDWTIGVLYGPHGAPDFFTQHDIEVFFTTAWEVHYNSDRTGVRLIGPKPEWARRDGGEAGLHPSNIHDNAYAVGTVDFTGDMPVILGPDGPSLGGFVCPATIVNAELWKMGQLRPGDTVRFLRLTEEQAAALSHAIDRCLDDRDGALPRLPPEGMGEPAVIHRQGDRVCRADGDRALLIEFGENVLDLNLRFRVHALTEWLRTNRLPGMIDLTPGIRSLQIHYHPRKLSREQLLEALDAAEASIKDLDSLTVPARTVHLPLSWDDPATQLAIQKYVQGVRPDAPWCPSNIEFIRRINGLGSAEDVHRIVFDASYLVMGLGDVYLGAPVATPLDPRHRLVTTKYNPARTWTPENAVGIGGAYLCIYGMEGPGGYQFVGRTVQMWNTYRTTREFTPGHPWLLRFFDQIRFYPVSAGELLEMRREFPAGRFPLRIEEGEFRLRDYHTFLDSIRVSAGAFKQSQQAAFEEERARWALLPPFEARGEFEPARNGHSREIPEGCEAIRSPITASVWNLCAEPGQRVRAGDKLLIVEAMKMEVAVTASADGVLESYLCTPGTLVTPGQTLAVLRPEAWA